MGIPGLNTWFKRSFSDAYVDLSTVKIDHLYIDMNSVLHLVLRRARNMHQFYVLLFHKCDFILNTCRPKKSVMFALDGPAPLAKLLTQRTRRKKVQMKASDDKGKTVSSLALTPGTPFMQEVHEALSYFICQRLIGSKWAHLRMELSGSTVQGEGECKILSRLQRPRKHVHPMDSHALIGNDSDLLMMSMMADCNRVFVLGQIFDTPSELPTSLGKLKVFSVEQLKKPLTELVKSLKGTPEQVKQGLTGIRRDLAMTCILSRGNDYLPSVGGLSLDRADEAYRGTKTNNGLWETYVHLRNGGDYKQRTLAVKDSGKIVLDYEFLHGLFQQAAIKRFSRKTSEMRRPPNPHLYLDGIKWILDMYSRGICPDYRFVYDGVGPSSEELCDAIKERKQPSRGYWANQQSNDLPLRPSECALALLPYRGRRYLPAPLQHLVEPDSPIGDLFQECEECAELSQEMSDLQKDLAAFTEQLTDLRARILKLESEADRAAKLKDRLEKIEQKAEAVRQRIRDNSMKREAHQTEKHPYEPFPIERIEDAVKNVPVARFTRRDHELFSFGHDLVFQRAKFGGKHASTSDLLPIHKNAPQPPSGKFKRFKVPLPILRGPYITDPKMARAGSQFARWITTAARRVPL